MSNYLKKHVDIYRQKIKDTEKLRDSIYIGPKERAIYQDMINKQSRILKQLEDLCNG